MTAIQTSADIVKKFIALIAALQFEKCEPLLNENMTAYITNAEGSVDKVQGSNAFITRFLAMNTANVNVTMTITQIVAVKPEQVLVMVEINASRHDKLLHNFASFLIQLHDNTISEFWMVEALPAASAEFWS